MNPGPYVLSPADDRLTVVVFPGSPTYVYVTHAGVTEEEIDAALLELTWDIPSPCCVIVQPQAVSG